MSENESVLQKLPPQNIEAEQSVLGAILINNQCMSEVQSVLREEDFYRETHRKIFSVMVSMHQQDDTIDLITIMDAIKRNNIKLESVGGASYLAFLVSLVPSAASVKQHAKLVLKCSQLRAINRICSDAQARAYDNADAEEVLTDITGKLHEVRRNAGSPIVTQREFVQAGFNSIEQRFEAATGGAIIGLPTGLRELDRVTGGLQPGYWLIAARPSMGKTSLAEQIRDAVARHFYDQWQQIPAADRPVCPQKSVGFISIEMGKEPLALRAISRTAKVPLSRLVAGTIQQRDWTPMANAAGELHQLPIFYEFESSSESKVAHKIDLMVQQHGMGLCIIDYTQLMQSDGKHGNREQEISSISRMIKHKGKQYSIPIIALAQLNRALEARARGDKRPMLSDLRESGALEQDADVIIFIYRDEVYHPCQCAPDGECLCGRRGRAQLLGRKGRMIGTWDIEVGWEGKTTSFYDV